MTWRLQGTKSKVAWCEAMGEGQGQEKAWWWQGQGDKSAVARFLCTRVARLQGTVMAV